MQRHMVSEPLGAWGVWRQTGRRSWRSDFVKAWIVCVLFWLVMELDVVTTCGSTGSPMATRDRRRLWRKVARWAAAHRRRLGSKKARIFQRPVGQREVNSMVGHSALSAALCSDGHLRCVGKDGVTSCVATLRVLCLHRQKRCVGVVNPKSSWRGFDLC